MSLCLCNEKTLSNRERCKEKIKFYALGASFLDFRDAIESVSAVKKV